MDQLSELRTAVQSDLTVGAESTLYTPDTVDLGLNRAYRKIGAMFKWEETRAAEKTSTIADHEHYEYPQTWRSNSIWKLTVDGTDYEDPLIFKDYKFETENDLPSGMEKIWSNYGKKFFIYPIPTTTGDKNISIHGYKFVEKLVLDGDITIFSYSMPEINEAIVLEAVEILKAKGEVSKIERVDTIGGQLLSPAARNIVVSTWTKISQEQAKLVRTTPQFRTPDFFGNRLNARDIIKNRIGNF